MSTLPLQPIPRTRLHPIGANGKSRQIMFALLALSIAGALASRSYSKGAIARIATNTPGAAIQVDGQFGGSASASGASELGPIPYGRRSLRLSHSDYEPLSSTIDVAWFSSNRFSLELKPIPLTLTIDTSPGAEVALNGQSAGAANAQGRFVKDALPPGDYDIQVSLPGHTPFRQTRHLSPHAVHFYAGLSITQERIQQMRDEQLRAQENAARVQQLLRTAQQQFNARQYQAALTAVDSALRLEPSNPAAQQLKSRLAQTIDLLK